VLLLNDKTSRKPPRNWKRIEFADLENASQVALVVEDVLSSSPAEFQTLKQVLHFSNHHRWVHSV
jgi:hypothetical protein